MNLSMEIQKAVSLAQRDLMKFLRDKGRIVATFVFPIIFVGVFGSTLNSGLQIENLGYSYIDYIFSGILIQTLFQSSLSGIVSLVADREKDFAMSIFVAPVSRISIIVGKLIGESLVSVCQAVGVLIFGLIIGVKLSLTLVLTLFPVFILSSIVGGSLGILLASRIEKADDANRIFPFLIFPMMFLSGAFTPVNNLPWYMNFLKNINPMHYGVDLGRNIFFANSPALEKVVSHSLMYDLGMFLILGVVAFVAGSYLFISREGNR